MEEGRRSLADISQAAVRLTRKLDAADGRPGKPRAAAEARAKATMIHGSTRGSRFPRHRTWEGLATGSGRKNYGCRMEPSSRERIVPFGDLDGT